MGPAGINLAGEIQTLIALLTFAVFKMKVFDVFFTSFCVLLFILNPLTPMSD